MLPTQSLKLKTNQYAEQSVSFLRRMGALLCDYMLIIFLLLIITRIWTGFGITHYPIYVAFINLSCFLYFGWFWTHRGQTPGMQVWKIYLLSKRNTHFSWPNAMTRSVVAIFSLFCIGIGFFWILFNQKKLAWHDILSDSYLVKIK